MFEGTPLWGLGSKNSIIVNVSPLLTGNMCFPLTKDEYGCEIPILKGNPDNLQISSWVCSQEVYEKLKEL